MIISRHVKVSQFDSHGLAHHESGWEVGLKMSEPNPTHFMVN